MENEIYYTDKKAKKGRLSDFFKEKEKAMDLYVLDYFMCLNDGEELHFFYNPMVYWDSCPVTENVVHKLKENCVVFNALTYEEVFEKSYGIAQNYNGNITYEKMLKTDYVLGNHYCVLGNHIYTINSTIYLSDPIERGFAFKPIWDMDIDDLRAICRMVNVQTKTPNELTEIQQLFCFED